MKPQPSNWNMRDSSGKKGLDETPQSVARGGSLAARGKRVYSSGGSRREYFDATSFSNTQLLLEIWKELLKRSTSKCSPSPKTYEKILSYKVAVQVNL